MKRDTLVIIIALTTLVIITAACAHITAIDEKDREIAEIQRIADGREISLQTQLEAALSELQPKPYIQPLPNMWVSSGTGYRTDPMGGTEERLHKGADLVGVIGTPVHAVLAGIVMEHYLPPDGGIWKGHPVLGGMITIQHEDGFSIYGHLSASFVQEGDWVEMGQVIGEIGDTGVATGPHLHLEFVVDPLRYLEERR